MKRLPSLVLGLLLATGMSALAQEKKELDIRVRAIGVIPQESATVGVIGGDVNISNSFVPEVDFTYYFAKNFSAELILGTTRHTVSTKGSDLTAIGGPSSADVALGKVWLLPPTLTAQYHLPVSKIVKPYIGAGANYTIFYGADKGPTVAGIDYKNKFAFATQLGMDVDISNKMFINIDLKKIFLSTDVKVDASNLTPAASPGLAPVLANIPANVKIRPWVVGVGIGWRIK